jgi:hypothetical protein
MVEMCGCEIALELMEGEQERGRVGTSGDGDQDSIAWLDEAGVLDAIDQR